MCGVSFVNQLDGADQALKIAQRRHGRFLNSTMMMTLLGAAVSDGLADGRVVSGVGGQYNFVAMAHSLPEARSILDAAQHARKEFQDHLEHPVELRQHHHSAPSARYRGDGIRRRGFARLERSGCDRGHVEYRGFALSGRPEA